MDRQLILESIVNHLDVGIIVTDEKLDVIFFKDSPKYTGGFDWGDITGMNILDIFESLNKHNSTFYYVVTNKKSVRNYVQTYTNYRGKEVSIISNVFPLFDGARLVGAVEIFQDLSSIANLTEKASTVLLEKAGDLIQNNGTIYNLEDMIGESQAITAIKKQVRDISTSTSNVLVYGETGTGKEVLVQSIHNSNIRTKSNPFVAQNCAAIPHSLLESILFGTVAGSFTGAKDSPGLFELADGGTLFLDEISSMSIELQSKLLRIIQENTVRRLGSAKEKRINVRLIAAANIPPKKLLEENLMRSDLFYRLHVIYMELPPLRERREDIELISHHLVNRLNKKLIKDVAGISLEAMEHLCAYEWPGNIRELENVLESAMNYARNGELIQLSHLSMQTGSHGRTTAIRSLPAGGQPRVRDLNEAMALYERSILVEAINVCGGNAAQAAALLSIPKQTMYNKMKKYELK